jgi:hypothetical protein
VAPGHGGARGDEQELLRLGVVRVVIKPAVAAQQRRHAADDLAEQRGDLVIGRLGQLEEGGPRCEIVPRPQEHAVSDEDVVVQRQRQRTVEALHHGHRASRVGSRRLCAERTRSATVEGEDDSQHLGEGGGGKARVSGEVVAHALGEGHDPLAHGHAGYDAVHQVRRRVVHPARGARGADRPVLAREGDEVLGSAAPANDTGEAVLEQAAFEEGAQLLLDVARQAAAVEARGREIACEPVNLLGHDAVEQRCLGLATPVGARGQAAGSRALWVRGGDTGAGRGGRCGAVHGGARVRVLCQRRGGVVPGGWQGGGGARPAEIRTAVRDLDAEPTGQRGNGATGRHWRARDARGIGMWGLWHAACLTTVGPNRAAAGTSAWCGISASASGRARCRATAASEVTRWERPRRHGEGGSGPREDLRRPQRQPRGGQVRQSCRGSKGVRRRCSQVFGLCAGGSPRSAGIRTLRRRDAAGDGRASPEERSRAARRDWRWPEEVGPLRCALPRGAARGSRGVILGRLSAGGLPAHCSKPPTAAEAHPQTKPLHPRCSCRCSAARMFTIDGPSTRMCSRPTLTSTAGTVATCSRAASRRPGGEFASTASNGMAAEQSFAFSQDLRLVFGAG